MRRLGLTLLLSVLLSGAAAGQVLDTGAITANSSGGACTAAPAGCAIFLLGNQLIVSLTLQVSGTYVGTLGAFEATSAADPTLSTAKWETITGINLSDGSSASAVTANGTGQFSFQNSGLTAIRVRATAWSSGTATITAVRGYAAARWLSPFFTRVFAGTAGTCVTPSLSYPTDTDSGIGYLGANNVGLCAGGATIADVSATGLTVASGLAYKINGGPITAAASVAAGGTVNLNSDLTRTRYQVTIAPATGDCSTAFTAAALTADCTIATLPAGMRLVSVTADVTAGFTCSGTCTGTKVMQAGTAAGGTQILAASLNVAVTGTFGLADADLGSGMTRAARIQDGLIGSWSTTTPVSVRFTSGTGNWGSGAATFVNAGSVKFTLITEQVK